MSNVGNNHAAQNINDDPKTEVFYDNGKILHKIIEIFSLTNESLDGCMDNMDLSVHVLVEPLWDGLCHLKAKGVNLRIITEMTNQNISYVEKMMRVTEVRHMDGIRSNFKIVDGKKCLLYVISLENSPSSHSIISNVGEMVDAQRYLFETLWDKAIPAEEKMKEMECGHINEKTDISFGIESATTTILNILHNSQQEMNICADKSWPSVAMGVEVFRLAMFDIIDRHSQSRFITEITKDNINFCKELLKVGKLRHLEGVKGNFAVSEKEYIASATMREAQLLVQVTYSNVKAVVESHQYLFETLWNKAIPAEQKIKEIEEGIDPVRIEVVYDSIRTKNLYVEMIENASSEIMVLFPTANGFIGQEKAGIIQLLRQAVEKRHIKVRILMPAHSSVLIQQHSQTPPKDDSLPGDHDLDRFLSIRHIQPLVDSAQISSILVTDKKHSLVVELKDDANTIFEEAIGLSTYSNSKPGVLSYVAIFENLWLVTELYEHIRNVNEELQKANEHLKINDKMQKEFINIAAHELRTPTQAILSFADLLPLYPDNKELGIMIQRNAKRLQRLIKDILDVTKIESQQLILRKGTVNIHDLCYLIQDYGQQLEKLNTKKIIKLFSQFPEEKNVSLIADKERLLEVISNIMDNAIKFIEKEGSIYFHVKVEETENNDDNDFANGSHVLITIKDTGVGISEEIFPRLFTRFASKSINGTGLGLYISKSIIEAHGGMIWAENNKNGNGATFTIRLPLNTNNKINYKQNEGKEGEDE